MKFNDQHKEVKEFTNRFAYGVHTVKIAKVTLDETPANKEFIELAVVGEAGEEDTARVWFTTDAATNYSFNVLRQIFVHNASEAKKDAARGTFDGIGDTVQLVALLQALVGKEAFFTVYPSPDRTYTAQDGTIKPSIDKNILGYLPDLKPELIPESKGHSAEAFVDSVMPGAKEVPFNSPSDASGTVPASDQWS